MVNQLQEGDFKWYLIVSSTVVWKTNYFNMLTQNEVMVLVVMLVDYDIYYNYYFFLNTHHPWLT